MTAIIGAPAGTYLTLRIYKRLATNPALSWANSYEFVLNDTLTTDDANRTIQLAVDLEKSMHLADVEFDRAVLSTWIEDGEPYDPTSFIVQPQTGIGERAVGGDPLSLNYCLFVRRETVYGRPGKLFWRRCMTEEDVQSPSGTPALENATAFNAALQLNIADTNFDELLSPANNVQLVMKSNLLLNREVTGLTVAGARVIQYNNRYFDVP